MLGPKPDLPAASSDDVTADRKNTNLASLYLVNTCKYSAFKRIPGNKWLHCPQDSEDKLRFLIISLLSRFPMLLAPWRQPWWLIRIHSNKTCSPRANATSWTMEETIGYLSGKVLDQDIYPFLQPLVLCKHSLHCFVYLSML